VGFGLWYVCAKWSSSSTVAVNLAIPITAPTAAPHLRREPSFAFSQKTFELCETSASRGCPLLTVGTRTRAMALPLEGAAPAANHTLLHTVVQPQPMLQRQRPRSHPGRALACRPHAGGSA